MEILFVSCHTSKRILDYLYETSLIKPLYSIQKFHRLLLEGIIKNGNNVTALSAIPVSTANHHQKFWKAFNDVENGIKYHSIPFLNLKIIRNICLFIYSFIYTVIWGVGNKKNKRVIFDVLDISICLGGLLAAKIVGLKSCAIVTDMPGLMVSSRKVAIGSFFIKRINSSYLSAFNYYVVLTEQMNPVVNIRKRPYIVMEGLVDIDMITFQRLPHDNSVRTMIYAGGLHERYGIKMLLDAFCLYQNENVRFSLYGNGPFAKELSKYEIKDSRIRYYGVVPNDKIVEEELKATLLVNPRPTHEEFTKYSFPSKNIEYMVSGTPVLTTKLPGMPKEYYEYVYLFDEETVQGYLDKIKEVFCLSDTELIRKGLEAKEFVIKNKNNIEQANRVLNLLKLSSNACV